MNPQYQPQPQFGDPSQQGFPSGRPNSNLNQSGLQDSFNMNNNPGPQPINNYMPPQQNFGYKGANSMGQPQPPPRQQLPPSGPHIMPGQMQNGLTSNQMPMPPQPQGMMGQMPPPPMDPMGPPPTSNSSIEPPYLAVCPPHPSGMNPPPNQMGPPPNQMGPPPNQMGPPPNQMGPPPNQMGPPPTSMNTNTGPTSMNTGSMGPPPTTMNIMGPSPSSMKSIMGSPQLSRASNQSNQMGPPPISMSSGPMGPPPSSMNSAPPTSMGSNQMGAPPTSMGSNQMGGPPTSMGSNQMGGPPTSMNTMGAPPTSMNSMGGPPTSMNTMGAPPTSMGSNQMGAPPTSMGSNQMGGPPTSMNTMGGPPTSINSMGAPPTSMSSGPSSGPGEMRPLPGQPSNQRPMGPPMPPVSSQLNSNSSQMPPMPPGPPGPMPGGNAPPSLRGQYQMAPPINNLPQTSMQPKPSPFMPPPSTTGPPPLGGQNPPPLGGQNPPPLGGHNPPPSISGQNPPPMLGPQNPPPMLGPQIPIRTNMAGMPPAASGPGQYTNTNKIGGPGGYPNNLPPLNQQQYNPNQLTNQMNSMQLNAGNRQYPQGSMKPALNGDNSMNAPHMPPPLMPGQQYVNGAQNRSPAYPPMPGQPQQQMPSGPYPPQPQAQYQQPQAQYQQPQQARRLDPDQMPSPIQVTLDDQKTRSGIFCTNQKGLVPPLVSTNFITQDQGNAGPRFIRSTMYNVPTTSDMMKQTAVPFGLVISPLARTIDQEYPPPIVDFGELGPVRCIRCKAYMCPFMQFIDSGRRFQCLFCKATTEVPAEYFQHLDHTGQRVDRYERPELILGSYEFVATKDYCRNNVFPKPPAIIFVIDVSYNNMKSGLVHLLCSEMKEILKHLPIDQGHERSKMKVGFITYNSTVHFYNIKGTLAQPQMMVVGDTQEMFVPLLDGFLCDIEDSAAVIDSLMTQIPTMFAETRDTEIVLLPAIQAGLEALKASECAGKLLVFHSTLPIAEAPGKLKNRDERKLLGTEKERTVLTPQNQAYNQLGQECVTAGCCVDLFITNNSYIDLATIGQISRLTGGEVFKYTYFQADVDGQRLINDIITDISRPIAFDSIMRVRTSTGIRPTDFYGHFFMSNTTDMEIPAIDCDKAVAIEIKHDDKLTEEEGVYIQVALLYTSCSGQRRLRVLNLSLKTCSQMADLYRSCELDTIVNFFSKQCVYKILENNPKAVKDSLVNRCAQMLACYRKNCASPSSAGQLILPECMKLLPLYVNCLMKSDAISGGSDMTLDDRSFVMQCVITMDIPTSVVYFYPRLIPLHELQLEGVDNPDISAIRCTVEKMVDHGVYLLENGIHMLVWIGLNANQEWIQNVFGASSAAQVDIDRISLPELDNNLNLTVRNLVDKIRAQRHRWMRLTLVRQRDKLETVFRHFLMEDRGQDGSTSYVDFLCHMHKEIRQLLS